MSTTSSSPLSPILELIGIVKTFPGVRALDEAGLRVYPGQVMALLGENGAGKSTLMKVLTGIYQADAGTISYRGQPVNFKGPRDSQDQGISIIHQELNLLPELSIAANIFPVANPAPVLAASTTNSCVSGPAACWRDLASSTGRIPGSGISPSANSRW